jgi:hypothetical protein
VRSISPLPRLARLALALLVVGCGAAAQGGSGAADAATAPPPAPDRALDDLIAAHPVFGPALRYRTVATDAAERALAAAADDLRRSDHGLSADLTWRPSVTWRGTEATAAPAVTWGSELTASFGYRTDAAAVVSARIALHRAGVAHLERVNRDLREAMTRHVELQRAWIARTLAEDAAAGRSATLASAERVDLPALAAAPGDPGTTPEPRTLLASRLEAERAAAAVDRAGRDLAEAERRATAAGFDAAHAAEMHRDRLAPLPLEGWRLWLPAADPLATPAVTRAALDLAASEATARRVRVGGLLDDLRIEAVRVERDARLRATVRLDEGRPAAALDLSLRPAARASWTVAWSAVLRLDDGLVRDLERVEAELADAAAAWAAAADEAPWTLALARQAALDEEADVAFGERGLALARLGLREALDAWRALDTDDPAARERAAAALTRAAVALERERDAYYRAWNRYLLAGERYWSAAGVTGGVIAPP